MTNRHYLAFTEGLRAYSDRIVPGEEPWQERVLADIYHDGTLEMLAMAPTAIGERVGIVGTKTFCEAGAYRGRADTLLVYRIEPARPITPSLTRHYSADIQLVSRQAPQRDAWPPLTASPPAGVPDKPPITITHREPFARPTPGLAQRLSAVSDEVRTALRPKPPGPMLNDTEFLARMRAISREHRLERFIRADRVANYLSGRISRQELGDDRILLQSHFSIALVEAFFRSSDERELHRFLRDLGALELAPTVRVTLWAYTLYGLNADALRDEIGRATEGLRGMEDGDQDGAISGIVIDAVTTVAQKTGDPTLTSLAESTANFDMLHSALAAPPSGRKPMIGDMQEVKAQNLLPIITSGVDGAPQASTSLQDVVPSSETNSINGTSMQSGAESSPVPQTLRESNAFAIRLPDSVPFKASRPAPMSTEAWVLRSHKISLKTEALRRDILPRLSQLMDLTVNSPTLHGAREVFGALYDIQGRVAAHLHEWPSPANLERDVDELKAALDLTVEILGDHGERLIELVASPNELVEIADLWRRGRGFVDFPIWVFTETTDAREVVRTKVDPTLLTDQGLRILLCRVLDLLERSRLADWSFFRRLPPPGDMDPLQHIEAAISRCTYVAEQLNAASEEHRRWLASVAESGHSPDDIAQWLGRIEAFRNRIGPEVFVQFIKRLEAQDRESPPPGTTLDAVEAAIRQLESQFGSAHDATWRQIDALVQREILASAHRAPVESLGLRVNHNFVDEHGTRVPLAFFREPEQPFAKLVVPLVLAAPRPISARLRLTVETELRKGWPVQWPGPTPTELVVQESSFRIAPKPAEGQVYSFKLVVPVRQPNGTEAVALKLTLTDNDTNKVVATRELKWDAIELERRPIHFNLPDATNPQYVTLHPTGPQNNVNIILNRIQNRSSFAVLAPRRFGKTTLVEYLRQHQEDSLVHVGPIVLCTTYYDARGLDYERVWRYVSDELQRQLGSSIDLALEDRLPKPAAFDHVRRAARAKGKSCVLLLFDEAQLMFPRRGWELGDRLKDLLERCWSRGDNEEFAPILFGFVGLPSLPERAGANLCGILRPISQDEIQEKDLNKIILHATNQGLHTTREARIRLARASRNLGVLRTLLEQLVQVAEDDRRNWISYDDVVRVERNLYADLRGGGQAHGLAQWVRDAVNDAETINDWRPSPCYPVALALAQTRWSGRDRAQIVQGVADELNRWARGLSYDKTLRAIYSSERVEEHLRTLVERGVIDKELNFSTEMFEAWLLGQSRSGYPENESAQQALLAGAVMHIVMPEGAEEVSSGGQANIFRYKDGESLLALRKYGLRTKEDRQRFIDTIETLNILMKSRYRSEDGGDYIFELRNIGLDADDPMEAVQVYRWVNGEPLEQSIEALSPELVVDIGLKLACALKLLHSYSILHRDVRPANVILARDGQRPVLIDFGLARIVEGESVTSLGSEYAAPEVRGARPRWSKAADIYSLGVTLKRIIARGAAPNALFEVLNRATSDQPEQRPTAEEFLAELKGVGDALFIENRKAEEWRRVLNAVKSDENKRYFLSVVNKFQAQFVAMRMGFHATAAERGADFADFLNQVLEAFPHPVAGERITLGSLSAKGHGKIAPDTPSIRCLQRLRNIRDHGQRRPRSATETAQHLGITSLEQLPDEIKRATSMIGKEFGLNSLIALAEVLGLTNGIST